MVTRTVIEAAIEKGIILKTLPKTRGRVVTILEDTNSTFRDVGSALSVDVVLVAALMRKANDLQRTPPEHVVTLTRAIRVIGFRAISDLITSQPMLEDETVPIGNKATLSVIGLWEHSLAVGLAASAIASEVNMAEIEECYVAGLLHDIGKAALLQLYPDDFTATMIQAAKTQDLFYNAEVESGEASHAQFGRLLTKAWNLPTRFVDSVGWHHTPQLATDNAKLTSVVHLADCLARALGLGMSGDPFVPLIKGHSAALIGLSPSNLLPIMRRVEQEFAQTAPLLR